MNIKNLSSKYTNLPIAIKATVWFTICNFVQRGMSMITTPIFTRLMSTDEYGIFSTFSAWENVLFMVVSLSLYKSLMNLYVKYDDYKRVLSVISGLELLITGLSFLIGIVLRNYISVILQIPSTLVCCLFVNFISQAAFQAWSIYKRYIFDYKKLVIATLMMSIVPSFVSIAVVMFVSRTANARAVSISVMSSLVAIVIYISIFSASKVLYDKNIWKFALGFCVPLLPAYLSEFVLQSSDKLMINYLCDERDVAIYSVAYSVGSIINLFANSVGATFSPYLYQKLKEKEYHNLSLRTNQILLFMGGILGGIMLFSREIVLVFGGNKYIDSTKIIIPICLGVFFNYLFSFFGQIQQFFERKRNIVLPSVCCAVLNLALNYIFIKLTGYQAAAYTTFVCYALFCIINYFLYKKVCKDMMDCQQVYDSRGIFLISLGVIGLGIVISILNRVAWIKCFVLVGGFIVLIFERNNLKSFIISLYAGER